MGSFTTFRNFVGSCFHGRAKSSVLLLALTFVLASCGGSSNTAASGPVPTASLTATPATIVAGQSVTLTWVATNADMGTINNNVGQVGLNGNTVLTPSTPGYPTANTTFTYTVSGPGGTATATATVTVNLVTSFDGMIQPMGAVSSEDVDPNGAVGTLQYLEYVNDALVDANGNTQPGLQAFSKTPPYAPAWAQGPSPIQINTIWPVKSPCNLSIAGTDPIQLDVMVAFDRLASRWVVVAKTTTENDYYLCIAVSTTDDLSSPSLSWGAYNFKLAAPGVLGTDESGNYYFPDWPKVGTWPDGYYVSLDEIDETTNDEVGVLVCAFDRPDILNNPADIKNASCTSVQSPLSNGVFLGHSLIPADVDGTTPPQTGRDEFMVSIENPPNDGSTVQGPTTQSTTFNLWDFHLDWTATQPLTLVQQLPITVTTYIPGCYLYSGLPAITNCVPENRANGGEIVDSVGDRFMPRFAYRNFGTYESFLISHTIQTGPGPSGTTPAAYQTGIRWYQLTDNGSGTPAVSQSGTINPDASLYRFLPSIAQDHSGNVAVGYSVSNALTDPGINFSYWNLTESAATAPTEVTIFDGTGEEVTPGTGSGKWGSYSSMTVDPVDDCTFWYVNEYFFTDNTWRTRIANFKIPGCVALSSD
jgi:hypothetical protein